jgi:predicted dehydrogenase
MSIRIGFIGAGAIARSRHLPGLRGIEDVEVVAVSNRTRASAESVARGWDIPEVVDHWQDLVTRKDLDAVFIGTWPYMHAEMSIAALSAGKHVFCQARMAMNLAEARSMVDAARTRPRLVNMVCPPPHRMPFEPFVRDAVHQRLGEIVSVEVTSSSAANRDSGSVSWREDISLSGRQILAVGIIAETLNAWVGPYRELSAYLATPIPEKTRKDGTREVIRVPQVVTIAGRLASGALATEHHLGLTADNSTQGSAIVVRGIDGTLRYRFMTDVVEMAAPGETLRPVEVPEDLRRPWRVERDFVEAVRAARDSLRWSVSPDFEEALGYMLKIEAVHESAETGRAVDLDTL